MQEKPGKSFEQLNSANAAELAKAIDEFPESDVLRQVLMLTPNKLNLISIQLNRNSYLWNHLGVIENQELINNLTVAINKLSSETDEQEIQHLIGYIINQIHLDI